MTIPGIGSITAMFIIAEIEDISRFPSYRNLSSYAGLVPCLDASADKSRTGKISKQGSRITSYNVCYTKLLRARTAERTAEEVIARLGKSDRDHLAAGNDVNLFAKG